MTQQGWKCMSKKYIITIIQRAHLQLPFLLLNKCVYWRNQKRWLQISHLETKSDTYCSVGPERIFDVLFLCCLIFIFYHSGIRVPSGSRLCCSALSSWWVLLFNPSVSVCSLIRSADCFNSFIRWDQSEADVFVSVESQLEERHISVCKDPSSASSLFMMSWHEIWQSLGANSTFDNVCNLSSLWLGLI